MNHVKRKTSALVFFSLALLLSSLPASMVVAPALVGTIKSCWGSDPFVNGHLDPTEWAPAGAPVPIDLYNLNNQSDILRIQMMSIYSAENMLYIAVIVPDVILEGEVVLAIALRTNPTVDFVDPGGATAGPSFGSDNDIKVIEAHANNSKDCVTRDTGLDWAKDTDVGGTEDSYARCHPTATKITFELRFPLDSTDIPGCDPALGVGSDIEIFTYFYNQYPIAKTYTQIREADGDYDYNILHIGGCTTPPTTTTPVITITFPTTIFIPTTITFITTLLTTFTTGIPIIVLTATVVGVSIVLLIIRRKRK